MSHVPESPEARRTLLLLGCGREQIEALQIARELGYRTVAFDNDPEAVGRHHADVFARVDLKNETALLGQAELANPDGVFVHAAELAVEAATVAEALGLPGLTIESARTATAKQRRIARFAEAGIQTPAYRVLDRAASVEAWQAAAREIGFPCVLKPTDPAGARGVERIDDAAGVAAYHASRTRFACAHFVCEERLRGLELSTESVRAGGKLLHHAIALRHYDTTESHAPAFIEDGHSLPYALPGPLRAEVERVIERAFNVLGVDEGVLKGDLLIDADGRVFVIEMAARTSGGRFADTVVPLGTGVNILYPLIELAMGDAFSRDWFTPDRAVGVSQRFFLHDAPGTVRRWPALRALVAKPWVCAWSIDTDRFRTGHLPRITSHRERLGYVICTGETREEADARALAITGAFAEALELEPDAETSR
ncbi:MAG: ATP-grasp domain-containing protein [Myxococcota bacterium]